jgi:hypothetical protein
MRDDLDEGGTHEPNDHSDDELDILQDMDECIEPIDNVLFLKLEEDFKLKASFVHWIVRVTASRPIVLVGVVVSLLRSSSV